MATYYTTFDASNMKDSGSLTPDRYATPPLTQSPSRVTGFVYFESDGEPPRGGGEETFEWSQGLDPDDLEEDGGISESGSDGNVLVDEIGGPEGLDYIRQEDKDKGGERTTRASNSSQEANLTMRRRRKLARGNSSFMAPTFSSKMHENDVIVQDNPRDDDSSVQVPRSAEVSSQGSWKLGPCVANP